MFILYSVPASVINSRIKTKVKESTDRLCLRELHLQDCGENYVSQGRSDRALISQIQTDWFLYIFVGLKDISTIKRCFDIRVCEECRPSAMLASNAGQCRGAWIACAEIDVFSSLARRQAQCAASLGMHCLGFYNSIRCCYYHASLPSFHYSQSNVPASGWDDGLV